MEAPAVQSEHGMSHSEAWVSGQPVCFLAQWGAPMSHPAASRLLRSGASRMRCSTLPCGRRTSAAAARAATLPLGRSACCWHTVAALRAAGRAAATRQRRRLAAPRCAPPAAAGANAAAAPATAAMLLPEGRVGQGLRQSEAQGPCTTAAGTDWLFGRGCSATVEDLERSQTLLAGLLAVAARMGRRCTGGVARGLTRTASATDRSYQSSAAVRRGGSARDAAPLEPAAGRLRRSPPAQVRLGEPIVQFDTAGTPQRAAGERQAA